jgi:hypothetical protein
MKARQAGSKGLARASVGGCLGWGNKGPKLPNLCSLNNLRPLKPRPRHPLTFALAGSLLPTGLAFL